MKFGNLNFLEPSGPLQACNGYALPFLFSYNFNLQRLNGLKFVLYFSLYGFHIVILYLLLFYSCRFYSWPSGCLITTALDKEHSHYHWHLYYYYYYYYYHYHRLHCHHHHYEPGQRSLCSNLLLAVERILFSLLNPPQLWCIRLETFFEFPLGSLWNFALLNSVVTFLFT